MSKIKFYFILIASTIFFVAINNFLVIRLFDNMKTSELESAVLSIGQLDSIIYLEVAKSKLLVEKRKNYELDNFKLMQCVNDSKRNFEISIVDLPIIETKAMRSEDVKFQKVVLSGAYSELIKGIAFVSNCYTSEPVSCTFELIIENVSNKQYLVCTLNFISNHEKSLE